MSLPEADRKDDLFLLFDAVYNRTEPGCGVGCYRYSATRNSAAYPQGMMGDFTTGGVLIVLFNPTLPGSSTVKAGSKIAGQQKFEEHTERLNRGQWTSPTYKRICSLVQRMGALQPPIPCYVTNAVKCGSRNAAAWKDRWKTAEACAATFLRREIEIVNPRLLLVLGHDALRLVVSGKALRKDIRSGRRPVVATTIDGDRHVLYHPHPASRIGDWSLPAVDKLVSRLGRHFGAQASSAKGSSSQQSAGFIANP